MTQSPDPGQRILWEGAPQTLTAAATGGKVQGVRYRLTPLMLLIDRGLVRTDSQQVPLVGVQDIDVKQSMSQKARGIGDVVLHVNTGTHAEKVTLESIKEPKQVRDYINGIVADAKRWQVEQGRSHVVVGQAPAPVAAPPAAGGMVEQLKELAALRDAGVLTDEEFSAQKARLLA